MMDMPCHHCPDRYPACSGSCRKPEYLAWREELARIKAARRAEQAINDAVGQINSVSIKRGRYQRTRWRAYKEDNDGHSR